MLPTEKSYYKDQYIKNITAKVLDVHRKGTGLWHAFDKTIFYPGGGGQSPDEGFINTLELKSIKEDEGIIWHELEQELNGNVSLELNWSLRLKRMQQHAGQHLISAVFYREYGINTVSVHLGHVDTLIEFDSPEISPETLEETEYKINAMIRENIAIQTHWVKKQSLKTYDLRRDIKVDSDPVRLVQIGNYDVTGCGGTHVRSTSEIGLVKIIGTERIRKHTRIVFKIGKSAYQFFSQLLSIMQNISNQLSSGYDGLETKISKLIDEHKNLRRILSTTRTNWLRLYAEKLNFQNQAGFFMTEDLSQGDLIDISLFWSEKYKKPCFFVCIEDDRYFFAIRSYSGSSQSAVSFIRTFGAHFDLKGGGSEDFAQGSIANPHVDDDYFAELKKTFQENI